MTLKEKRIRYESLWEEIRCVKRNSKAFFPGEIIMIIAVVNRTVIKHMITVKKILKIIKLSGELSDYGLDVETILSDKLKYTRRN